MLVSTEYTGHILIFITFQSLGYLILPDVYLTCLTDQLQIITHSNRSSIASANSATLLKVPSVVMTPPFKTNEVIKALIMARYIKIGGFLTVDDIALQYICDHFPVTSPLHGFYQSRRAYRLSPHP